MHNYLIVTPSLCKSSIIKRTPSLDLHLSTPTGFVVIQDGSQRKRKKRKKMIGHSFYRKLDKSNLASDRHFDKILTKLAKFIDDNPFWWIWPWWFRLCFTCLTCGLILNFKTRWLRIVIFVKLLRHINVALCVECMDLVHLFIFIWWIV